MEKRKKRTRRLIVLGLCMMMLMSIGMMASASTYPNSFNFSLQPWGDSRQTGLVTKNNYNAYASIHFAGYFNESASYGLLYRLRGRNNVAASSLYNLTGEGLYYPRYSSGEGNYGSSYFFRIQTDSLSAGSALVSGSWKP